MITHNVSFDDITSWMAGDADEATRAAIRDELSRADSLTSRHLAWMADPMRSETDEVDPLVEPLLASLGAKPGTIAAATQVWPYGRTVRRVFALAATLLVGVTIGLAATRFAMRTPVDRMPGDTGLFELHVNQAARPATWDEIWADNVTGRDTATANVDRLRRASSDQVKNIIDNLRANGRQDFEILTALKAAFGPRGR